MPVAKPYTTIKSLSPGFVKEVVERTGRPDNFVDSPEGSFVGMPDVDSDPASQRVLSSLEERLRGFVEELTDQTEPSNGGRSSEGGGPEPPNGAGNGIG
jgi:hypothetical protein